QAIIDDEAGRPFDLQSGPPIRAMLIRLDQETHVLTVVMHHIASDLESWDILCRELGIFYRSLSERTPLALPGLPIQYADHSVAERQRLGEKGLQEQVSYWKKKLGGSPAVMGLPLDRPRPAVMSFRGALVSSVIPESTYARVRQVAR